MMGDSLGVEILRLLHEDCKGSGCTVGILMSTSYTQVLRIFKENSKGLWLLYLLAWVDSPNSVGFNSCLRKTRTVVVHTHMVVTKTRKCIKRAFSG